MKLRTRLVRQLRYPMRWLSFLASGVPVILLFPAPSLSYLAWFALVPAMVLFTRAATTREAVARGWWFGAGYLIAMLYWMAPEIGPGLVLLGAVMGWMWSPFAVAVHKLLRPGASWWRIAAAFVVVPSCWLIPEWIRSYQGLGGPWDLYGASQWQHPAVLALAAIGGVWLVSVALLMANVALVLILGAVRPDVVAPVAGAAPSAEPGSAADTAVSNGRRARAARAACGAAAFAVVAGAGPLAFALTPPFPVTRTETIALVQPGVVDDPVARTDASETLTAQFSAGGRLGGVKPDLIVWAESSIPDDLAGSTQSDRALLAQIEALSKRDGAEILVSQDTTPPGKGHEKWAVLVSPAGIKGTYVKSRLVPFGEYIPFRDQLGWLTSISKASPSNMVPGSGAHLLDATGGDGAPLPIGVLICFESAFPDMSRADADLGAQLIVYQSSTTTFQGTWGPDQHASLGAIRAAETGRPVVQAALTGDTAAFDARGRQLAWLGQDGHGVVTVTMSLPPAGAKTFYDQAGDYVMWSGVAITLLAALVMLVRRRHFLGITTGAAGGRTAEYDADTGDPVRQLATGGFPRQMRPQGKANLVLRREAPVSVYGVLQVHSAPPALCPHIEWAVAGTVGATVSMPWVSQAAAPGSLRAELTWKGRPGTAGAITSALAGWNRLRFEVTEEASPGCDAMRYCYTPNLGLFSATTSANGDILLPENKLRAAMALGANGTAILEKELERLLGSAWDNELEPFRRAGDGAPVRWLNATG